jgi:hypothetical protein
LICPYTSLQEGLNIIIIIIITIIISIITIIIVIITIIIVIITIIIIIITIIIIYGNEASSTLAATDCEYLHGYR